MAGLGSFVAAPLVAVGFAQEKEIDFFFFFRGGKILLGEIYIFVNYNTKVFHFPLLVVVFASVLAIVLHAASD